jgi:hypothetical protein
MSWQIYVAYFFGGAFLANALPHLLAGISGKELQSPFASPPFQGLSSPAVNVAWSLANLALAYLLLVQVGKLDVKSLPEASVCLLGFGAMAFQCARSFTRLRTRIHSS